MLRNRFVAKEVPTSPPFRCGLFSSGRSAVSGQTQPLLVPGPVRFADPRSMAVAGAGHTGGRPGGCTETGGGEQHGRCSREGGTRPARLSLPTPPLPPHLRPYAMTTSLPPRALLPALSTPPCLSFFCRSALGVWNSSSATLYCPDCRMQSDSTQSINTPNCRIAFHMKSYFC